MYLLSNPTYNVETFDHSARWQDALRDAPPPGKTNDSAEKLWRAIKAWIIAVEIEFWEIGSRYF